MRLLTRNWLPSHTHKVRLSSSSNRNSAFDCRTLFSAIDTFGRQPFPGSGAVDRDLRIALQQQGLHPGPPSRPRLSSNVGNRYVEPVNPLLTRGDGSRRLPGRCGGSCGVSGPLGVNIEILLRHPSSTVPPRWAETGRK